MESFKLLVWLHSVCLMATPHTNWWSTFLEQRYATHVTCDLLYACMSILDGSESSQIFPMLIFIHDSLVLKTHCRNYVYSLCWEYSFSYFLCGMTISKCLIFQRRAAIDNELAVCVTYTTGSSFLCPAVSAPQSELVGCHGLQVLLQSRHRQLPLEQERLDNPC